MCGDDVTYQLKLCFKGQNLTILCFTVAECEDPLYFSSSEELHVLCFAFFTSCQSCSVLLRSDDCAGRVVQSALLCSHLDFKPALAEIQCMFEVLQENKNLFHRMYGRVGDVDESGRTGFALDH